MRLSLLETGFWYTGVLRAAGLPYGAVAAGVQMVQWADIHHGIGHAFLERRRADLSGCDPTAPRVTGESETGATIDAGGQSSLLVGPGALDLATTKARNAGSGTAIVTNLRDLAWLGRLAEHAAERGLACFLSFAAGAHAPEAADLAALYSTARGIVALPGGGAPLWIEIDAAPASHERLMAGDDAGDLVDDAFAATGSSKPGVALVCRALDTDGLADLRARVPDAAARAGARVLEPAVVAALARKAIEEGIEVDDGEWRALATNALSTVIPGSERSLTGAGA